MDHRVDRVIIVLLVMMFAALIILGAFLPAQHILGFTGDYWAGILCVGGALLVTGWGLIMWLRSTRGH